MHTLGKVLAFLVVVAALVAGIFTSKLITVRNSWTQKTLASKDKAIKAQAQIDDLEAKIARLKAELFRSQDLWGGFWNGIQTSTNPDGSLMINIGATSGIRQNLVLYGFETTPEGGTIYRGSFTPVEVRDASTTLKPNWRVTPEEVATWQQGPWRWRNAIPPGHSENIDQQLLTLTKEVETLGDRQRTLAGQKILLDEANQTLKVREAELVGGDLLEKSATSAPEFRDGLVATVEAEEEKRNQELEKVDELRRKIREAQARIEQLQTENDELVQKLPGAIPSNSLTQKK